MVSIEKEQHSNQHKGYTKRIVFDHDVKYLPPYFQNVGETLDPVRCHTIGEWPDWLNGDFIRLGVGQYVVPTSADGSKPNAVIQHWFDGLGMLHKFHIGAGEIWYNSRYTSDGLARKAKVDGYVSHTFFGNNANEPLKSAQDPCSALLGASQSAFTPASPPKPDEVIVNVVPRRGMHLPPAKDEDGVEFPEQEEILNQTDWNLLQVCDAKTLKPKRMLTYAEIDAGLAGYGICAHPPKDRERGMTFNYIISELGVMSVFALDIRSNPTRLVWKTALPCEPCYIHSLAMTKKFVVFVSNPLRMEMSDPDAPIMDAMKCNPSDPGLFYVLDKTTGAIVAHYSTPHSFIFFHSVNAFDFLDERTGLTTIHVDLCSYEGNYHIYGEYNLANLLEPAAPFSNGRFVRYELADIESHSLSEPGRVTIAATIPGIVGDMPRIAKSASMNPAYRYVYIASEFGGPSPGTDVPLGKLGDGMVAPNAALFSCLAKLDWQTGRVKHWQPQDGESCPCEPVFVQRPGSSEEDDGIVLTIVINKPGTHSILIALNAVSFKEIARARMPQVYTMAPHGTFIEV